MQQRKADRILIQRDSKLKSELLDIHARAQFEFLPKHATNWVEETEDDHSD